MQRAVSLMSVLVLGSAWVLQAIHGNPTPLIPTQEDFDIGRVMGTWYEIAVAATCPRYMQRKRANPVIVTMELRHVASARNFTKNAASFRNGSCYQKSTDYTLTDTPGRFFYHIARAGADVDSYVVDTNYDEYVMLYQQSTEKPSGNTTLGVKLYSRTKNVTAAVLGDFKKLVRQHGMSDDDIIMNQDKGDCSPGVQVTEPVISQPQVQLPVMWKRHTTHFFWK